MKETLMIRLGHTPNDPIHWLISNADEAIASGQISNSLALEELSEKATTSRKIAKKCQKMEVAKSLKTTTSNWNAS